MAETALFGSALSVVLPPGASDVSKVRQIPDNQEVFTHSVTDQSVIIEILEYVEETDDQAIKTHFEDIAQSNEVANDDAQILHIEELELERLAMAQCSSAWYVLGQQKVAKFNEAAKNTININLGLFRLPEFSTDILVTFNDPVSIDPSSSSHHAIPTSVERWTEEHFKQMLTSLNIHDSDIFGC